MKPLKYHKSIDGEIWSLIMWNLLFRRNTLKDFRIIFTSFPSFSRIIAGDFSWEHILCFWSISPSSLISLILKWSDQYVFSKDFKWFVVFFRHDDSQNRRYVVPSIKLLPYQKYCVFKFEMIVWTVLNSWIIFEFYGHLNGDYSKFYSFKVKPTKNYPKNSQQISNAVSHHRIQIHWNGNC